MFITAPKHTVLFFNFLLQLTQFIEKLFIKFLAIWLEIVIKSLLSNRCCVCMTNYAYEYGKLIWNGEKGRNLKSECNIYAIIYYK